MRKHTSHPPPLPPPHTQNPHTHAYTHTHTHTHTHTQVKRLITPANQRVWLCDLIQGSVIWGKLCPQWMSGPINHSSSTGCAVAAEAAVQMMNVALSIPRESGHVSCSDSGPISLTLIPVLRCSRERTPFSDSSFPLYHPEGGSRGNRPGGSGRPKRDPCFQGRSGVQWRPDGQTE